MAVVTYSCTKCKPVDTSVIEAYMVLVNTTNNASRAEASRASAETDRAEAEAQRSVVFASDHSRAMADHSIAQSDHDAAGADHASSVAATASAVAAAALAGEKAELVQTRLDTADADHTRADGDHSTAVSDHSTALSDHTVAQSDHATAGTDHAQAASDHSTAASDHTDSASATAAATGAAELANTKAALVQDKLDVADADHSRAEADHTLAASDHTTASSDHTQASADHAQASTDHTTASADHTQAASDHTLAAADHTTAGADHTQALADHEVMAGYDTRLTEVEGDVTELEAEVDDLSDEFTVQVEITALRNGYISTNGNYDPGVYGLSGCKCADISVQPGQVYNIYGTGANHNYYRLYAVFASDGTRLDRDTTSGDYTQTPRVVTIPDGGVHLVVNLYQYNATTDKILRVGDRYNAAKLESEFFEIYNGLDKVLKLNDKVIANNELNLLDASKYVNGCINPANGTVTSSNDYRATDYILLSAGVKYFFGRLHNTQFAFYDLEKSFLANTGYYHYSNYGQGYILTDRDCYFRATAISLTSSPFAYISAIIDGYIPYGEKSFFEGEYAGWLKTPNGSLSPNLFNGLCEYGEATTRGELKDGINSVRTMPIYCTGTIYIKLFGGKAGDLQYIYEYDEDDVFVKYDMVYTTEAKLTLDASTKSIRIVSQVATQTYTPPTTDFFRSHLFVTNDADVFGKWLPSGYTITAKDVDDHFYDTASTFEAEYIKTALDSHIATIKHTGYDAVIPCMTDIHLDDAEPYKMLNYLAASGIADVCFNLGDTIRENFPTKAEAEKVLENAFRWSNSKPRKSPLLSLRGNHDTNPVSDATAMISTREFAALAENRTMLGYASNTVNYGYLDLPSKIRLIWLDTSDIFDDNGSPIVFGNYTLIRQGQLDWLCEDALNFTDKKVPGDWSVIILSHDGVAELYLTAIITAFVAGSSASGTINYARKAVDMQTDVTVTLQYDVDFSEQGPVDMLCCVCGHYHKDKISDIGTSGVKQVYIACDNTVAHYDDGGTDATYERTHGTIEEHICDTICVDKATRTVLFKRIGVGSDRSITY